MLDRFIQERVETRRFPTKDNFSASLISLIVNVEGIVQTTNRKLVAKAIGFKTKENTMNSTAGVYWLVHQKSQRIYIGSTGDFKVRKQVHLTSLAGGYHFNKELQNDYNRDPVVTFTFFETKDKSEATKLEQEHLNQYFGNGRLYNASFHATAPILGGCDLNRGEDWRKNQSCAKDEKKRAVEIEGVRYDSITAAARTLGLNKTMVTHRAQSANFEDWKFL